MWALLLLTAPAATSVALRPSGGESGNSACGCASLSVGQPALASYPLLPQTSGRTQLQGHRRVKNSQPILDPPFQQINEKIHVCSIFGVVFSILKCKIFGDVLRVAVGFLQIAVFKKPVELQPKLNACLHLKLSVRY